MNTRDTLVANFCQFPNFADVDPTSNSINWFSRSVHDAPEGCMIDTLKLVYCNIRGSGTYFETPAPKALTVASALELSISGFLTNPVAADMVDVTWGTSNADEVVIPPGAIRTSNVVNGVFLPRGARFAVRSWANVAGWASSSDVFGVSRVAARNRGEGRSNGTTGTKANLKTAQIAQGNLNTTIVAPVAILGRTLSNRPCIWYLGGDSHMNRTAESTYDGLSYAQRAIGEKLFVNGSRGSESSVNSTAAQRRLRMAVAEMCGCNKAMMSLGTNDLFSVPALLSLDQLFSNLVDYANDFTNRGMEAWFPTVVPRTTSIDGWLTTANQSQFLNSQGNAINPNRITHNDRMRSDFTAACNRPDMVHVYEMADPIEVNDAGVLTRNGGKFATGTEVDSGTATGGASSTLNDSTKAWLPNQWALNSHYVWIGSGTGADVAELRLITANTATQLTFAGATAGVGSVYKIIKSKVHDGTHFAVDGSIAIGAAVGPTLDFTVAPEETLLAASQPLYAPAKAGDAMGLTGSALSFLGGRSIETVNPVGAGGRVDLVIGDDYSSEDGRELRWIVTGAHASLATAEIILAVKQTSGAAIEFSGEVSTIDAEQGSYLISVNLDNVDTSELLAGWADYQLVAVIDGRRNTQLFGRTQQTPRLV